MAAPDEHIGWLHDEAADNLDSFFEAWDAHTSPQDAVVDFYLHGFGQPDGEAPYISDMAEHRVWKVMKSQVTQQDLDEADPLDDWHLDHSKVGDVMYRWSRWLPVYSTYTMDEVGDERFITIAIHPKEKPRRRWLVIGLYDNGQRFGEEYETPEPNMAEAMAVADHPELTIAAVIDVTGKSVKIAL